MDGIPPSICPIGFYQPPTRPSTLENVTRQLHAQRGPAIPARNHLCTTILGMAKRLFRRAWSGINASRNPDIRGTKL